MMRQLTITTMRLVLVSAALAAVSAPVAYGQPGTRYQIVPVIEGAKGPAGLAVDRNGDLIFVNARGEVRVRSGRTAGDIRTLTGGGDSKQPGIFWPTAIAVDPSGQVYVAELSHRVVKIGGDGTLATVAGTRRQGFSGDGGPATSAQLNVPGGLAVDADGNLYIADSQNDRVRRVTAAGVIMTVAGGGQIGSEGEGAKCPDQFMFGITGRHFVIEAAYECVLRNTRTVGRGMVESAVGATGSPVCTKCGDGGPAISAVLTGPIAVAVDAKGNLFIADQYAHRVRRVTPGGVISTVAGNGSRGLLGRGDGGPAIAAELFYPRALALDSTGNLFIAEMGGRIRRVDARGAITTIKSPAQEPRQPVTEVPLISEEMGTPGGLAVDPRGQVFFADTASDAIVRLAAPAPKVPPAKTAPKIKRTPGS